MISVILGLVLVAMIGGGVAVHVRNNPTSAKRLRARRTSMLNRDRGGAVSGKIARGGKWVWTRVRTRTERAEAKTRAFHAAAKKRGKTAATRATAVIKDRRGWRAAWSDIKEAVTGRPATAETAEAPPEREAPKPTTADRPRERQTTTTDTEEDGPVPKSSATGPTLVNLFEVTDQMNTLPFISLVQIRQFVTYLGMGCESIARMYIGLAQRMDGPMSIDRIVTEPVQRCGSHQRAIHGSVGQGEAYLVMLLNSTPQELLSRGIQVPKAALLNSTDAALGRTLVPIFYETASGLARRPFTDLRDVHALLKGLAEASAGQFRLYRRIATRLTELRLAGVADHFWTAARQQGAITAALADADTAMGRLLNMTLMELAASNVRAPEVNLTGV